MDPIYLTNLILCVIIVILGWLGSRQSGESWPIFIASAFGLFGVSHLLTILGLREMLSVFLIVIRTIAYVLVIFTLFKATFMR